MAKASVQAGTIAVRGANQLVRDFGRLDADLKTEVQDELRSIGDDVAKAAQANAVRQDLVDSGALVRDIRVSVRQGTVKIYEAADRDGFPYPTIHEFKDGGVRAFMGPAVRDKGEQTEQRLGDLLDRLSQGYDLY